MIQKLHQSAYQGIKHVLLTSNISMQVIMRKRQKKKDVGLLSLAVGVDIR